MLFMADIFVRIETVSATLCFFFYDWKPAGTEQDVGHRNLLLQWCFVSITQSVVVFVYFCPSSGVNKTPLRQRGVWVMRLASLEALHLTGHEVSSGDPREMDMRLEETLYAIFLCVFMRFPTMSCTATHNRCHINQCIENTKHYKSRGSKELRHNKTKKQQNRSCKKFKYIKKVKQR